MTSSLEDDCLEPRNSLQGIRRLPLELWRHIFLCVPWHSREPITYVCQAFRWLAQPLLFENLEIQVLGGDERVLIERLQFLISPRIAPAVKVCRMYSPTMHSSVPNEKKEIGLNAVPMFKNLLSLRLEGFTISNSLLTAITELPHLSELELLRCTPGVNATSLWRPAPLFYLKWTAFPIKNDNLDVISASLVHPKLTHNLILGHRSYKFLRGLLDTGSTFSLRSLTLPPAMAASLDFYNVIDICPLLEELRFRVERINVHAPASVYTFHEPSETSLTRLKVFQGPSNMIETFTKERPVSHLVIWDFDEEREGTIKMLSSQGLRYPIQSLELYLHTLTTKLAGALASMTVIKALSLVVEMPQTREVRVPYSALSGYY
jgi:hypothetical protein